MTTKDKCPACGKKMKLICPYEWTMKDERAFKLGEKSQKQKIIKEIKKWKENILQENVYEMHLNSVREEFVSEYFDKDVKELLKTIGEEDE